MISLVRLEWRICKVCISAFEPCLGLGWQVLLEADILGSIGERGSFLLPGTSSGIEGRGSGD